jgi:hypothetical protein
MDGNIRIRAVGLPLRDLLIEMYDRFDPLGVALGLPPHRGEARREWIGAALGHKMNLAAFSPSGAIVGHCFSSVTIEAPPNWRSLSTRSFAGEGWARRW